MANRYNIKTIDVDGDTEVAENVDGYFLTVFVDELLKSEVIEGGTIIVEVLKG